MSRRSTAFLAALVASAFAASAQDKSADDDGPCGLPPEAKPERIKAGEGVPPLPLPATPLRRTERKREPAPPILVGKVVWGQQRSKLLADGRKAVWSDWNTDPADIQRLLKFANAKLGTRYRYVNCDPRTFSFDPTEIPILYIQGRRAPPSFDAATRKRLRQYLEKGGTLWADACHGSKTFADAFRAEMKAIFPEKPLATLPPDHPVFRSCHAIQKLHYSPANARPDGLPILEGLSIGCRTVVFLSPFDLSCAWDSFHVPEDGACVVGEDAVKLGINLAAYSIASYELGRFLSQRRTVETKDESQKGDFVFAQVKTNGDWDPDPSAFASLLKATAQTTNTKVSFGRKDISLADPDLASHPFLYLTGHGDFTLSDDEVKGLAKFLANGGFLLADACCGNLGFAVAFRRELKRCFPDRELALLPKEHPVFSAFHEIATVAYTPQVRADFHDLAAPHLEGLTVGDETRVIYSRFDLGCGWEGEAHPFALGVEAADALKLGTNVVMYSLTH
ncbi:MAG TPA: DUF4159 domain-containing protein [Planctomycetota bacterium]|nr:DUF4159 domain-containing protein [Planctomycetota bacterium]